MIVEPVQGRAGSRVPPDGFLETLRARCDETGALLVVDAIYAGLGRVGELWPGADVADVLCIGKALGGGLPLSAALFYRDGLEDLWKLGPEDVYTHTHVGNPLACAAALVLLDEAPQLLAHVLEMGERFEGAGWHGRGLLRARTGSAADALERGVLVVPAGLDGSLDPGDAAADDHGGGGRRGARASRPSPRGGVEQERAGNPPLAGVLLERRDVKPTRASAVTTWPSRQKPSSK